MSSNVLLRHRCVLESCCMAIPLSSSSVAGFRYGSFVGPVFVGQPGYRERGAGLDLVSIDSNPRISALLSVLKTPADNLRNASQHGHWSVFPEKLQVMNVLPVSNPARVFCEALHASRMTSRSSQCYLPQYLRTRQCKTLLLRLGLYGAARL